MNNIDAGKLVDEIDSFSDNQLKRKNDLLTLVSLSYKQNKNELLEEISFTSKYVQGLFRVLKQGAVNPEVKNIDQVKSDISSNIEKVKEKIGILISHSDEKTKEYFNSNYLQLSQVSLFNLTELMNDFDWTKKYLNQLKRNSAN